ncbi:enoyl-CoA hydratase-related protein [Paraurantiacibacter namhicola]|uniref:1,2-epoxyphenylacetyl-CoA isomerase n=1 Tax=Paraurantiacibacter namhicola TaxID=645517 RepID=A0A1C7D6F8_9SPHN|nr:enoyl-CoA hydratase-related protein [Paraurantiacibacter namhicola]ANU07038.1 1,2-epoxyphenylacetyl-CoA isomerase [Paraurantiacibacter namhicola]
MSDPVTYSLADNVATITLNRPDRLNALSPSLFEAWHAALDKAEAEGARAVVLTGEGRAFCAGADLQPDEASKLDPDLGVTIDKYYNPMIRRLAALDIPIVTAVNGPAVGAGMGFALAGDIVVAAQSAYFLLAFVNIGLVPDAGATWLIAKSVGRAKTMELALLGDRVPAGDALAMGLVNRVAPDDQVLPVATEIARKLAAGPSVAIGMIRKQVDAAMDSDLDTVLEAEKSNQSKAGRTKDFREAVTAFVQKREPQFKGE